MTISVEAPGLDWRKRALDASKLDFSAVDLTSISRGLGKVPSSVAPVSAPKKAELTGPVAELPSKLTDAANHHLELISNYGPHLSVKEFRELAQLGREAVGVLAMYVEQGLVTSAWQSSAVRYSISDLGEEMLQESVES